MAHFLPHTDPPLSFSQIRSEITQLQQLLQNNELSQFRSGYEDLLEHLPDYGRDLSLELYYETVCHLFSSEMDHLTSPLYQAGKQISALLDQGHYRHSKARYHSCRHFLEVLLNCFFLTTLHNSQNTPKIPTEDAQLLFFCALIHDLDHNGKTAKHPFQHEENSYQQAAYFLDQAGVSALEQHRIHLLLLSTDVGYGLAYIRYLQTQQPLTRAQQTAVQETILPDLATPAHAQTLLLSRLLLDADIFCSTALSYGITKIKSSLIEKETGLKQGAEQFLQFVDKILQAQFSSDAGQKFLPILREICRRHQTEL